MKNETQWEHKSVDVKRMKRERKKNRNGREIHGVKWRVLIEHGILASK